MLLDLRDYQDTFKRGIETALHQHRSVLGVLPTGGGKTRCFTRLAQEFTREQNLVVHRKELLSQISMALAAAQVEHRIIAPDAVVNMVRRTHLRKFKRSWIRPNAPAGVSSVQTLTARSLGSDTRARRWLQSVQRATFDEGHHYTQDGVWGRAVGVMPRAQQLFVTATPERTDGVGLGLHSGGFCAHMIEGPSTKELMARGFLCGYTYKCPETSLNLSNVPVTATGEVSTRALRKRIQESNFVGETLHHYKTYMDGKQAIIFDNDIATGEENARILRKNGVSAVLLTGDSDPVYRERQLQAYEAGEIKVLINVNLFDEGLDVPGVEGLIIGRLTESLAKYLQMCGRVFRPVYGRELGANATDGDRVNAIAEGPKPKAIIVDAVGNWERHFLPDTPRFWTLDGARSRGAGAPGAVPSRVCPECTQPYPAVLTACSHCGAAHVPPDRTSLKKVGGALVDLDVAAFAQLFQVLQRENLPLDEFKASLWDKNVPKVGHARLIRLHKEKLHRRATLDHLIASWAGAQHPRPLPEIQRRFMHRFGIDIAHAMTLPTKETDQLINKISENFTHDLY